MRTQYFEMLGHRAIYHDGWRAVCPWPGPSFAEAGVGFGQPISAERLSELDAKGWELYHVDDDFAENDNVADEHRDRLIALIGTWYVEAGKYGVLPIDGSGLARMVAEKPLVAPQRAQYRYYPDTQSIPFFAGPRVLNRPHSITAEVDIPEGGAEGVLLCQGTAAGGYSFFVKDGKLRYVHNYVGRGLYGVESESTVPTGQHVLRFEFEPTGKPDLSVGRGRARAAAAVRRRRHGRRCARRRSPPRSPSTPVPSPADPTRAHRSRRTTRARSGSPVTSSTSRSTSAESSSTTRRPSCGYTWHGSDPGIRHPLGAAAGRRVRNGLCGLLRR